MAQNVRNSITTCSKIIYYSGSLNLDFIIKPEESRKLVSIIGNVDTTSYSYLCIYDGESKRKTLFGCYNGLQNIPLFVSTTISLSTQINNFFYWRSSLSFQLIVSCIINSQTIYNLIKNNNCRMISCDSDYKSQRNILDSNTGECIKNCKSTNKKYLYRGKCYNICPENTINDNFICYSNSIIEKCKEYSIESENLNLCIKCK